VSDIKAGDRVLTDNPDYLRGRIGVVIDADILISEGFGWVRDGVVRVDFGDIGKRGRVVNEQHWSHFRLAAEGEGEP
jgi:hypothetical protein